MKNLPLWCWLMVALPVTAMAETIIVQPNTASVLDDQVGLNKNPQGSEIDENILWALFHARKYTQLTQQLKQLKQRYPAWQPSEDLNNAIKNMKQVASTPATAQKTNRIKSTLPDERILWDLFHAKKYSQLAKQTKQFQQQYSRWKPPRDLTKALQALGVKHSGSGDVIVKTTPSNIKNDNRCTDLPAKWLNAEHSLKKQHTAEAVEIYQQIIEQCPIANKKQTVEKAQSRLLYADFKRLLTLSSAYFPSLYIDYLQYQALKNHFLNHKPADLEQHKRAVNELNGLINLFKDDDLAAVIAWRYSDLKDYPLAQKWFQKAVVWNPRNESAQYGQVLSLEKAGNYQQALAVYAATQRPAEKTKAIVATIYKAQAWQNYAHKQFNAAAENTVQAEKISGLDTEIQTLKAWIANQNEQYASAAQWFESLYQQSPSKQYAQGYIQNQTQVDRGVLANTAEQTKGILLDEYQQYHGTELYQRKQFQSAFKLSPNSFPLLQNIDSLSVDLGGYVRYKSGENGLGRLDLFKAPVATAAYTLNGDNTFKLNLSRIQLYAGNPTNCQAGLGSLTPSNASSCSTNAAFSPTQQLDDALEIDFSYRKTGWLSPFVKIGSTPIGGVIDPTVTYDVGFEQQAKFGHWGLEVYSQPVRQSILSYTGIKDPYGQGEWGRVLRTGITPKLFYRFNEQWNSSLAVDFALLEGKNVKQNTTVSVAATFARNLPIAGFDYFNVGPTFNYEHFERNLSHFTYGQGGYFSPDHYFNVGAGINFLTEEGKSYVIKGRLVGGYQDITEASASWLPLDNQATGRYAATNRNGAALDFALQGVWLMTPHIQLGASSAIRKTNGYDDYTGGLFVRYFFNDRKASFSTDLSNDLFSSMY